MEKQRCSVCKTLQYVKSGNLIGKHKQGRKEYGGENKPPLGENAAQDANEGKEEKEERKKKQSPSTNW